MSLILCNIYFFVLMHVHFESLYTEKKNHIVLTVENMKEVSPEMSSYPNNLTFRCCKSTMFMLQTCFISLRVFLFCFVFGVSGMFSSPTHTESVLWVWILGVVTGRGVSVSQPDDHLQAEASLEAASNNCFFLTHKWRFMHSSLFC